MRQEIDPPLPDEFTAADEPFPAYLAAWIESRGDGR
jgi:hypothetical protein